MDVPDIDAEDYAFNNNIDEEHDMLYGRLYAGGVPKLVVDYILQERVE